MVSITWYPSIVALTSLSIKKKHPKQIADKCYITSIEHEKLIVLVNTKFSFHVLRMGCRNASPPTHTHMACAPPSPPTHTDTLDTLDTKHVRRFFRQTDEGNQNTWTRIHSIHRHQATHHHKQYIIHFHRIIQYNTYNQGLAPRSVWKVKIRHPPPSRLPSLFFRLEKKQYKKAKYMHTRRRSSPCLAFRKGEKVSINKIRFAPVVHEVP